MITVLVSLSLGVIGSLLAAAFFPGMQSLAASAIVRRIGWLPFGQPALLGGLWTVTWHVQSDRYAPSETDESVQVRQLGKRVYARFRTRGGEWWYVVGTIDGGRYVTGTWYDATQGGYHGAFQLIIDPGSHDMAGLWIGFSRGGIVKSGAFEWKRRVAAISS